MKYNFGFSQHSLFFGEILSFLLFSSKYQFSINIIMHDRCEN